MDSSLNERVHQHRARRQEILIEIAAARREKEIPVWKMGTKRIEAFCSALPAKLKDKRSNFGKEYLRLLVDENKRPCSKLQGIKARKAVTA